MNPVSIRRASAVRFEQVEPRKVPAAERGAIDEHWTRATAVNPNLFDGQLIEARSTSWEGTRCLVYWSPSSYAAYLWRYANGVEGDHRYARALFTSVVVTTTARTVLLGLMGTGTSAAGRLQLPGGNVELAKSNSTLTLDMVRQDALRELEEETGVGLRADALQLWAIKENGAFGDVGVFFRADAMNAASVREEFARQRARLAADGSVPEFTDLHFSEIGTEENPGAMSHSRHCSVDYLPELFKALRSDLATQEDINVRG